MVVEAPETAAVVVVKAPEEEAVEDAEIPVVPLREKFVKIGEFSGAKK